MDAVVRAGCSPRRLMGWEPVQRLRPDGRGGWIITREPEWDELDQAMWTAHLANESVRCGGCGGYLDETTARDDKGVPEYSYVIHEDVCGRCNVLDVYRESKKDALKPGTLLSAEQHTTADLLARQQQGHTLQVAPPPKGGARLGQ